MPNTVWQFAISGTLKYGRGCRLLAVEQLRRLGVTRPLIVVDQNISRTQPVSELLGAIGRTTNGTVFDECQPEPQIGVALAACEAGRQAGVDGVVGIGGGSNLDVAKVAANVLRHGGQPQDYFGFDRVPGPILPLVVLPTTAGTGSEVSHSAVLTDSERQIKVSTLSPWLRPACALVDPELSDSCPPRVTAHSGIDALVHAIEAYTNRDYAEMVDVDPQARAYEGSYPLTRLLAAEAIRLIGGSLVQACAQPNNQSARDDMALAATLAGMAFSNSGVGIVHALEYPIGALTHCGHGEGNGLLLPHVMRYNLPVCTSQFANIARWLGVDTGRMTEILAAQAAVSAVENLLDAIGITRRLRDFGMQREAVAGVAEKAFEIKRLMDVNRQTPRVSDLEAILIAAF